MPSQLSRAWDQRRHVYAALGTEDGRGRRSVAPSRRRKDATVNGGASGAPLGAPGALWLARSASAESSPSACRRPTRSAPAGKVGRREHDEAGDPQAQSEQGGGQEDPELCRVVKPGAVVQLFDEVGAALHDLQDFARRAVDLASQRLLDRILITFLPGRMSSRATSDQSSISSSGVDRACSKISLNPSVSVRCPEPVWVGGCR